MQADHNGFNFRQLPVAATVMASAVLHYTVNKAFLKFSGGLTCRTYLV